jgi:toxin-antitoxin system PIN domain toxin
MTSYLIDINVWLALTWDLHPQNATAARWYTALDESSDCALLFCRITMLGFLRLLTNRAVMGDSTVNVTDALDLYDRWSSDPRIEMLTEPRQTDVEFRAALAPVANQPSTKAIADCYLIGLAAACGAHVVTLDKSMASLAKRRKVPVTLLHPRPRI